MIFNLIALQAGLVSGQSLRKSSFLQQQSELFWFNVGNQDYGLNSFNQLDSDLALDGAVYVSANNNNSQSKVWQVEEQGEGSYRLIFTTGTDEWGTDGWCINADDLLIKLNPVDLGCSLFKIIKKWYYVQIITERALDGQTLYLSLVQDSSFLRDEDSYFVSLSESSDNALWETNFEVPNFYWFNTAPKEGQKTYQLDSHSYRSADVAPSGGVYLMGHYNPRLRNNWVLQLQEDGTYSITYLDNTDKWGTDGYCVNLYEDRFLVNPPEDGCASFILKYEGDYVTIEYVDDDDTTTLYLSLVVDDANLRDKWSYFVTVSDDLTSSLWETNFVIQTNPENKDCDRQITYESVYGREKPSDLTEESTSGV